jgi:hypothetical protein
MAPAAVAIAVIQSVIAVAMGKSSKLDLPRGARI